MRPRGGKAPTRQGGRPASARRPGPVLPDESPANEVSLAPRARSPNRERRSLECPPSRAAGANEARRPARLRAAYRTAGALAFYDAIRRAHRASVTHQAIARGRRNGFRYAHQGRRDPDRCARAASNCSCTPSVYRKGGRWWLRFKGADGRWHGAPAKATTKPAARLEALERERLARQQREGLTPSADNMRRTFGELMNLWHERYGSRLRSQTITLSVEKHLRPALGKLLLGGAAAALPALLNSKIGGLSPSTLNHLRAYCHRLYAVASMRSVGWWMGPNPVNRLELPKFKEPRRKRPTIAAEDVPRVLAALSPQWRPLFATAFFLGLRRGELVALQKENIDLRDWTITVRRSGESDVTKGGDDGTVPIPEPLRPYVDAAIKLSPSKWVFPAADGSQRAPDTNLKAVLRRALGRAGIVD